MKACLRFLASVNHAGLAGGFVLLAAGASSDAAQIVLLLIGWLYGVAILGLIRLFRVARWAYPIVGMLCGPIPSAVLFARHMGDEEWGGTAVVMALGGLVIGLLEAARESYLERRGGSRP